MLGVISIIRRSSIIVSFVLGAFIFKEKMLKRKSLALLLMLGGVILTMFGTL
jgi:transporter family protein